MHTEDRSWGSGPVLVLVAALAILALWAYVIVKL
jgi:hypothetical protein